MPIWCMVSAFNVRLLWCMISSTHIIFHIVYNQLTGYPGFSQSYCELLRKTVQGNHYFRPRLHFLTLWFCAAATRQGTLIHEIAIKFPNNAQATRVCIISSLWSVNATPRRNRDSELLYYDGRYPTVYPPYNREYYGLWDSFAPPTHLKGRRKSHP